MTVNTIWDGWTSIADIEANFMFNHTDEEFLIASNYNNEYYSIGGIVMFRQYGYFGIVTKPNYNQGGTFQWQVQYTGKEGAKDYITQGYFGPHIDTQELENLIDSYD